MDIVTNCCLCENRSLYVVSADISQCMYCGYVTSDKFKGTISENEEYKKLPEDMQKMAKENDGQIWIPSVMTLPFGMLSPIFLDDNIFWSFSPMVEIPENERENYPDGKGGYYENRYDNTQTKLYKKFHIALESLNGKYESDDKSETKIKLPKLKKVNG
jgi:hypothetical protein